MNLLRQLFFDLQYRFSKPPWDSGVTPPEVVAIIAKTFEVWETSKVSPRALDLGCGTGTNSIFLAQQGFAVVAVDFSAKAINAAREKAKRAGVVIDFRVGDVTRLDSLSAREPFDFVLDIGCLHAIEEAGRARYAEHIAQLTHTGSTLMLYAFSPRPSNERGHWIRFRNVGILPEEIQELFSPHFIVERIEHGEDRGARASAWYWLTRQ